MKVSFHVWPITISLLQSIDLDCSLDTEHNSLRNLEISCTRVSVYGKHSRDNHGVQFSLYSYRYLKGTYLSRTK